MLPRRGASSKPISVMRGAVIARKLVIRTEYYHSDKGFGH